MKLFPFKWQLLQAKLGKRSEKMTNRLLGLEVGLKESSFWSGLYHI